ncbi:MAG: hypothetical protein GY820_01550 [Gammaproteobacteria bacterium]|nr:hypothetical protein [Gammaproteobacteria bacterium]
MAKLEKEGDSLVPVRHRPQHVSKRDKLTSWKEGGYEQPEEGVLTRTIQDREVINMSKIVEEETPTLLTRYVSNTPLTKRGK